MLKVKNIKIEQGSIATDWTPAPEDKVNVSDMRKPASDVAGIEEVNAKQDKIGYTPADDSKVVHDNKDGTEQLNGVQVQPFNKLSDSVGGRNLLLGTSGTLKTVTDASGWNSELPMITPVVTTVDSDTTYTVRVWIEPASHDMAVQIVWADASGAYHYGNGNVVSAGTYGYSTWTSTITAGNAIKYVTIAFTKQQSTPSSVSYKEMKLEKGSVATDWCLNPLEILTQAEADVLKQMILNRIKSKTINVFPTVGEMKNNANNLLEGMKVKTLGYYQANDAGAATYYVTAKPDVNKHYEALGNTLFAELIDDHYNLAMRGAKTDGSEDISQIFNEAVKEALANDGDKTIRLPAGTFLLTNSVNLPIRNLSLTGENGTTLLTDTGTDPAIVLYGSTHWTGVRRSIENIRFREKYDKKARTKAILIGDENFIADKTSLQAAAQFEFMKCGFTNYDTGIVVGNDAYLFDIISCSCSHLNRFISTSSQGIMNSGEKIGIANCILTACSDTVFYLEDLIEIHVTNSSIDSLEGGKVLYVSDPEYAASAHLISFTDCHFEPGNITKPIFEIAGAKTHCALDIENSLFWLNKVSAESLIACGDLVNTINFNNNFIGTRREDQMTFISDNYNANITNTSLNNIAVNPVAFSQNIINNHRNKFKNASLDGVTDLISNVAYGVGNVYSIQRDNSDFSDGQRITTTNAKMSIDSDVPQGMPGRSIKIDVSGRGFFNFDFMAPVTGKGILEFAFNIKSNINLGNDLICYHLSSDGNASSSFEFPFYRTVKCDNAWEQFYSISAPYKLRGGQSFAGFRLVLNKKQLGDAVTIKIYNPYVNVI